MSATKKPYYTNPVTGKRVPGVTTALSAIAKPALIGYAAKETAAAAISFFTTVWDRKSKVTPDDIKAFKSAHVKKKEDAAGQGTWLHSLMDYKFGVAKDPGPFPDGDPAIEQNLREGVTRAFEELDLKLVKAHGPCHGLDYGGTADHNLLIHGTENLTDYKTGTGKVITGTVDDSLVIAKNEKGAKRSWTLRIVVIGDVKFKTFDTIKMGETVTVVVKPDETKEAGTKELMGTLGDGIYDEYHIQTAAYAWALGWTGPRAILKFAKDFPAYYLGYPKCTLYEDYTAFRAALALYNYTTRDAEWRTEK